MLTKKTIKRIQEEIKRAEQETRVYKQKDKSYYEGYIHGFKNVLKWDKEVYIRKMTRMNKIIYIVAYEKAVKEQKAKSYDKQLNGSDFRGRWMELIFIEAQKELVKEINIEIGKATNEDEELSAIARVLNKKV